MMRHLWLGALLCVTVALGLTSALLARQGVLQTKDGRILEGDIDESGSTTRPVMITLHGVQTSVARADVRSIDYSDNTNQEFNNRLKRLPPRDVPGRLELANWALDRNEFALASQAAADAQRLEPHNPDVALLIDTIKREEILNSEKGTGTAPKIRPATVASATTTPSPQVYLGEDEINTIRKIELRPEDNVRVQFLNDVRARYLAGGGVDANQYAALSPAAQTAAIVRTADPQMMHDIKVLSDPMAITDFRNRVLLRVEVGCAAAGCHGGGSAGSFRLYPDATSTAAVYTNFYILQTYKIKLEGHGFGSGPADYAMVDRVHPNSSLLVQFGLPMKEADMPHPKAPGWKPLYNGSTDPYCTEVLGWIGGTLKPFESDYGFNFELPPFKAAATQPAAPAPPAAPATPAAPSAAAPGTPTAPPAATDAAPAPTVVPATLPAPM